MDINTSMVLVAVAIGGSVALCSWARHWSKVKLATIKQTPAPRQARHSNG